MLEAWMQANGWTSEQWLVVLIIAFVIVAILVIMYRLYGIFKMTTQKRERPNLRVARRLRR